MVQKPGIFVDEFSFNEFLAEAVLPGLGPRQGDPADSQNEEAPEGSPVPVDSIEGRAEGAFSTDSAAQPNSVRTDPEGVANKDDLTEGGGELWLLNPEIGDAGADMSPTRTLSREPHSEYFSTDESGSSEPASGADKTDDEATEFDDEDESDDGDATVTSASETPAADPDPVVDEEVSDDPVILHGTSADEELSGGAGADEIYGEGGDDTLHGGQGDDRLNGGWHDDTLFGDDGDDYLFGSYGNDTQWGGAGNDEVRGGYGDDTLYGGAGDDFVQGFKGHDTLSGGAGNDTLDGGAGDDTFIVDVHSGAGDDLITDTDGSDSLKFDGLDPFAEIWQVARQGDNLVFDYEDGGSLTISDFYGVGYIEKATYDGQSYLLNGDASTPVSFADFMAANPDRYVDGTDDADVLSGAAGDDVIHGLAGDDDLSGLDGTDTIYAGSGDDTADGGSGADVLYGGFGEDTLRGGAGDDQLLGEFNNDQMYGDGGDDYLFGSFGNDHQWGGEGNDNVRGGYGNDTLYGDAGDDIVEGFSGNDVLDGGAGNDTLGGGTGRDTFIMKRGYGSDVVSDFATLSAGAIYADKIDISDFGFTDFGDLVKEDTLDGDTLLQLGGGDQLRLVGVDSHDLQDADFLF
ncbi:MAG: calcium-binding protein [Rhodospirillales bacterium]|nr:calcium-binding protein [Rhodospirillales bacterium]